MFSRRNRDIVRISGDRLFHSRAPATAKARSPTLLSTATGRHRADQWVMTAT